MPTEPKGADAVLFGSADVTKKGLSRRDFLKLTALLGIGPILAGCFPDGKNLYDFSNPLDDNTIAALLEQSKKIESMLSIPTKAGITRIEIDPLEAYGKVSRPGRGSGFVMTDGMGNMQAITMEHVGKGIRWLNLKLTFPNHDGPIEYLSIDARISAPGGSEADPSKWYIYNLSEYSDLSNPNPENWIPRPIKLINIHKPEPNSINDFPTNAWKTPIYNNIPKNGDLFIGVGFPAALKHAQFFRPLEFDQVALLKWDPDAGVPLWHFKGQAGDDDSGGPVFTVGGELAGIIRGGHGEGIVTVVPIQPYLQTVLNENPL